MRLYKVWYRRESNQWHEDFQSSALPTELRYLPFCGCKNTTFFSIGKKKTSKTEKFLFFEIFCIGFQ